MISDNNTPMFGTPAASDAPAVSDPGQNFSQPTDAQPGDGEKQQMINRDPPDPPTQRAELVKTWTKRVQGDKAKWASRFAQMKDCTDFVLSKQWSKDEKDDRYVANIIQR